MRSLSTIRLLAAAAGMTTLVLSPICAQAAPAAATSISLVDVAPDGTTPGNGGVGGSDISDDGRYVVFTSMASNLVPNGVAGTTSVFVRDTRTGTTTLVSGGLNGQPADGRAEFDKVAISGNGRYVAFASYATNLVPGGTSSRPQIFVYDRKTTVTTLASVLSSTQLQGNLEPAISDDGRYVAYLSAYTAYVYDMKTGQTVVATPPPDDSGSDLVSAVGISGNGKRVVFAGSGDWVGDGTTAVGVFVVDLGSGKIVRASTPVGLDDYSDATTPSIDRDGAKVTWQSPWAFVKTDTNHASDVYLRNLSAHTTTLVSANQKGADGGDFDSFVGRLSASGRYVAFSSQASDLVPNDLNGFTSDVFLRNLSTGRTILVSSTATGSSGNQESQDPTPSADGSRVVFRSEATDLGVDPGDGDEHLFVRRLHGH